MGDLSEDRRRRVPEGNNGEEEETPTAIGTMYTHWDCPNCEEENVEDSDVDGEECTCVDCGKVYRIRRF